MAPVPVHFDSQQVEAYRFRMDVLLTSRSRRDKAVRVALTDHTDAPWLAEHQAVYTSRVPLIPSRLESLSQFLANQPLVQTSTVKLMQAMAAADREFYA